MILCFVYCSYYCKSCVIYGVRVGVGSVVGRLGLGKFTYVKNRRFKSRILLIKNRGVNIWELVMVCFWGIFFFRKFKIYLWGYRIWVNDRGFIIEFYVFVIVFIVR